MISTNALSVFLLYHHLNRLGNENLRLVQEVMHACKPAADKLNNVCDDFPESCYPREEFYTRGDPVSIRPRGRWEKVTWRIRCGFRPRGRSKLTFSNFVQNQDRLRRRQQKYPSPDCGSTSSRRCRQPRAIQETARLDFPQCCPLPAIFDGGHNSPRRFGLGRALEYFRPIHDGVGVGRRFLKRGR